MCVIKDSIPAMFRVACLILCLVGASLQVSIISINEFAVPEAIKAGESAELQCQYGLAAGEPWPGSVFVKWFWTPLGAEDDALQIYQLRLSSPGLLDQHGLELQRKLDQRPSHKLFSNIEIKDNYTILLKDLQPKHSGRYECEVSAKYDEEREYQNMVVYTAGSGPWMNISEVVDGPDEDEEDDVQVYCHAHGVAPRPDLVITLNRKEIPEADSNEEVKILPDGLFDIAANATFSKSAALGATIRCELFYMNSNVTHEAFYVDHVYEEMGAAKASAPASAEAPTAVDSTTEAPDNTGAAAAWSLAWGLLAPAALLAAAPSDLYV